jgi:hypothetical protein
MLGMNRPIAASSASPRRFLLLPEQEADVTGQGTRIRRYRLTSVGRTHGLDRPRAKVSPQSPSLE